MKKRTGEEMQKLRFLKMLANDIFSAIGQDEITEEEFEYFVGALRARMFKKERSCFSDANSFWIDSEKASSVVSVLFSSFCAVDENLVIWRAPLCQENVIEYLSKVFVENLPSLCGFGEFLVIDDENLMLTELVINKLNSKTDKGEIDFGSKKCVLLTCADYKTLTMIQREGHDPNNLIIYALFSEDEIDFDFDIRVGLGTWHVADFFRGLRKRAERN